ncbi:MAG: hypothetical protein AAB633_01885, partial [Patescibacteria group bacterium]
MTYSFSKTVEEHNSAVIFIEKNQRALPREARDLPEAARVAVVEFLAAGDFKGEVGEVGVVYP